MDLSVLINCKGLLGHFTPLDVILLTTTLCLRVYGVLLDPLVATFHIPSVQSEFVPAA